MVNYHLALAKAKVGDFEGAELLLPIPQPAAISLASSPARRCCRSRRNKDAIAMLEASPALPRPHLIALLDRLKRQTLPL